jgi:hypothetical protein
MRFFSARSRKSPTTCWAKGLVAKISGASLSSRDSMRERSSRSSMSSLEALGVALDDRRKSVGGLRILLDGEAEVSAARARR